MDLEGCFSPDKRMEKIILIILAIPYSEPFSYKYFTEYSFTQFLTPVSSYQECSSRYYEDTILLQEDRFIFCDCLHHSTQSPQLFKVVGFSCSQRGVMKL